MKIRPGAGPVLTNLDWNQRLIHRSSHFFFSSRTCISILVLHIIRIENSIFESSSLKNNLVPIPVLKTLRKKECPLVLVFTTNSCPVQLRCNWFFATNFCPTQLKSSCTGQKLFTRTSYNEHQFVSR